MSVPSPGLAMFMPASTFHSVLPWMVSTGENDPASISLDPMPRSTSWIVFPLMVPLAWIMRMPVGASPARATGPMSWMSLSATTCPPLIAPKPPSR